MKRKLGMSVIHEHRWVQTNPFHRAADRCSECDMYRYEVMGPFARRAARLEAYRSIGNELNVQ